MEAARSAAPIRPSPKRVEAIEPARGSRARAASAASVIEVPETWRVAAHATTMKKPITPVSVAPVTTSMRSKRRSAGVNFLSTA